MAAPAIFQTQDRAADSDHLLGALVVAMAFIAPAEVARPVGSSDGVAPLDKSRPAYYTSIVYTT